MACYNVHWRRYARSEKSSLTQVNSGFSERTSLAIEHSNKPLGWV
jgi:hypothetical protein